jgi:hypothetical protein
MIWTVRRRVCVPEAISGAFLGAATSMTEDARPYLWLTRWPPYPPRRGGDIDYSRHLMHSLAACAPVRALAFGPVGEPLPSAPGLAWTLVDHAEPPRALSILSPLPNVTYRHLSPAYLAAAVRAASGAQAVFVDFIGLFWIVPPLMRALRHQTPRPRVVVVNHNFEHGVRRQMVLAEQAPIMKAALAYDTWKAGRVERRANRLADALVANTPADQALFARVTSKPSVVIMPGYTGPRAAERDIDARTPPRITILGNHEAHHKRMVLERTLAALAAQGVERRYPVDVVGAGDHGPFQARWPGFNYLGYVGDIEDYLKTVRLALIPDEIGGGFKHRVLTHVFQRTPMLAVRQAVNGMGIEPDVDYAAADDLAAMAAMIPALIDDFPRLNRLQEAAFRHCDSAFDWADRGRALHDFAGALIARASPIS